MSQISKRSEQVDAVKLLHAIKRFHRASLAGEYYAPFNVNSKNWMHIPRETQAWFERLGALLQASAGLTKQKEYSHAIACFEILYELIERMERGQEIVFADELGSWMIPGDEKKFIAAYLKSLAAIATPEEFTARALPLIRRDSHNSFADQVYHSAIRVATKSQKALLQKEIERQNIKIGPV